MQGLTGAGLLAAVLAFGQEFEKSILPALTENCGTCRNPANPKNRVDFLRLLSALIQGNFLR